MAAVSSLIDWRHTMLEDERKVNLGLLYKFHEALKIAPNLSTNQRFILSKKWEDDAYNRATSKEEYSRLISKRISILQLNGGTMKQQTAAFSNQQMNMDAATSSLTDLRLTTLENERKANLCLLFRLLEVLKIHNLKANQRFISSKKWEEDAYNSATSKEEYSRLILERILTISTQFNTMKQQTGWRLNMLEDERKVNVGLLVKTLKDLPGFLLNIRFILSKKWEDYAYNKATSKEEYTRIMNSKMLSFKFRFRAIISRLRAMKQQTAGSSNQHINMNAAAPSSAEWRLNMLEDERKVNVDLLVKTLKDLTGFSVNRGSILSKKWEDYAYNKAASKEEYTRIMNSQMSSFKFRLRAIMLKSRLRAMKQQTATIRRISTPKLRERTMKQQTVEVFNQQMNIIVAAPSPTEWRLNMLEDERKVNVGLLYKLLEALKFGPNISANQRFITSKKLEHEAFSKATSKEEYALIISNKMSILKLRLKQQNAQQQQHNNNNYNSNSSSSNSNTARATDNNSNNSI